MGCGSSKDVMNRIKEQVLVVRKLIQTLFIGEED